MGCVCAFATHTHKSSFLDSAGNLLQFKFVFFFYHLLFANIIFLTFLLLFTVRITEKVNFECFGDIKGAKKRRHTQDAHDIRTAASSGWPSIVDHPPPPINIRQWHLVIILSDTRGCQLQTDRTQRKHARASHAKRTRTLHKNVIYYYSLNIYIFLFLSSKKCSFNYSASTYRKGSSYYIYIIIESLSAPSLNFDKQDNCYLVQQSLWCCSCDDQYYIERNRRNRVKLSEKNRNEDKFFVAIKAAVSDVFSACLSLREDENSRASPR